jgi:hypothetical protein
MVFLCSAGFTYLLTQWSRALLEKLTGSQLLNFPTFFGNRKFVTAVSSARIEAYSLTISKYVTFLLWGAVITRTAPSCRTTPCRLSAIAYPIYSRLSSILEAVPPSATWGRAMPWWQGPTYAGLVSWNMSKSISVTTSSRWTPRLTKSTAVCDASCSGTLVIKHFEIQRQTSHFAFLSFVTPVLHLLLSVTPFVAATCLLLCLLHSYT